MNIQQIPVASIFPNPKNPRKTYDQNAIEELAQSMDEHGLIQPITVRPIDDAFQIVVGHRRWRAALHAEWTDMPCIVREMSDKEVAEAMLVENLQRVDVDPVEEAQAVDSAIEQGMSIAEVALRLGKSRQWVATRMQIACMGKEIHEYLRSERLTIGHLQVLALVRNVELRNQLAKGAASRHMTISELRAEVEKEMRSLDDAPWDLIARFEDDEGYIKPCHICSDQTASQADLFGESKANRCIDGECWNRKLEAHIKKVKEDLKEKGVKVVDSCDTWQAKNGYSGFVKNEDQIEKLKAAGVAPRMLINESTGQIEEVYNERDIPKSQATIDAEASADAAIQAEREGQRREERIQSAMDEILLESVLKHGNKISEATFLRLVADAAVCNSNTYSGRDKAEKIFELLPADPDDVCHKTARESKSIDPYRLRCAVLYWAIQSIGIEDIEPAIWKEFGISLKKARVEAEKRAAN